MLVLFISNIQEPVHVLINREVIVVWTEYVNIFLSSHFLINNIKQNIKAIFLNVIYHTDNKTAGRNIVHGIWLNVFIE